VKAVLRLLIGSLCVALGIILGLKFSQFKAVASAKGDAREFFNRGTIQRNDLDGSYFVWPKSNQLPEGFRYFEELDSDLRLVVGKFSNDVLFYIKPIYYLDQYVIVYQNGIISEFEGTLNELQKPPATR
jgi:hypothetical protein